MPLSPGCYVLVVNEFGLYFVIGQILCLVGTSLTLLLTLTLLYGYEYLLKRLGQVTPVREAELKTLHQQLTDNSAIHDSSQEIVYNSTDG